MKTTAFTSVVCGHLRQILFCLMTILGMMSGLASEVRADKPTDDFNLAVGFYRTQRFDNAADSFQQFLKDYPEHPRATLARLYYALSLSSLDRYAPAREQFELFLKAEPDGRNSAEARYRLGECSYYLRDYKQASVQLSDFLTRHPENSLVDWARLFLGDTYVALTQFQDAVNVLEPLTKKNAASGLVADAHLSLGRAFEGLKQPDQAVQQYQSAIQLQSAAVTLRALSRLGTLEYNRDRFQESSAAFEQLLTLNPSGAQLSAANLGAGRALFRLQQYDKAIARLTAVPVDTPNSASALLVLALVYQQQKKPDDARRALSDAQKAAGDSPLAIEVAYQRAQFEQSSGNAAVAAQLYADIADRWSDNPRVPDCLFNAAELSVEQDRTADAQRYWKRLSKEYPESASGLREQILLARLQMAESKSEEAIATLTSAVAKGGSPDIVAIGRYYLIRAAWDSRQHDLVVAQATLLSEQSKAEIQGRLQGALAIAAISSLELKQYDRVIQFADLFLPVATDADRKRDIQAAKAVSLSHLKKFNESQELLKELIASGPEKSQTWAAVLQSAEAAMNEKAYDDAAGLFSLAADQTGDPKSREAGLSGIAWSHFRNQQYADAEKAFGSLSNAFPESADRAQILFMQARSVEEQKDPERTAAAWKMVFETLTANQPPAVAEAETKPPLQYAFDGGRQAARALEKLNRLDEADKMWEAVARQFPAAQQADLVLDEWAWMHVNAGQFERSDAIHRQLLERFPSSPYAGSARLSLAESLLQAGNLPDSLKEMQAIMDGPQYGAAEKERSLFHMVEIHAATRQWRPMKSSAEQFLSSFQESPLIPQVRLFLGDALLQLQEIESASTQLEALRTDILSGKISAEDWIDRTWIVLAEVALAAKRYEQIDELEKELSERSPKSKFLFQMCDIQGRRWKQQAPPDFARAREYLTRAVTDEHGKGTETAARCQSLIADTWVMENNLEAAVMAYFAVYLNYAYDDLRVEALYQAAMCEARLNRTEAAVRDFRELIATFPQSGFAAKAKSELEKLEPEAKTP